MPDTAQKPEDGPVGASSTKSKSSQLRELHGRGLNNRNEGYMLPGDSAEHARLDMQHNMIKLHMQDLFTNPQTVRKVLAAGDTSRRPVVLDVGTGSGRWAVDMALEFPHADVIGFDLVEPTVTERPGQIPANCRFEVKDANNCMSDWTSQVDVLQARAIGPGVNDFNLFLYDTARCLRPNGVLLLSSFGPQVYHEDYTPFPLTGEGQPGFTWVQWLFGSTYDAYRKQGNYNIDNGLYWQEWLEKNPNFESVEVTNSLIPVGAWQEGLDERQKRVAIMMRDIVTEAMHSFKPLMLSGGEDPALVDRAVEDCATELRELMVHGCVELRCAIAVRRDTPWQPRVGPKPPFDLSRRLIVPRTPRAANDPK